MVRRMDRFFEGMLTVLEFLRKKRLFGAHAKIAPDIFEYAKEHHFIPTHESVSWTDPDRIEHRGYAAELAAGIIARCTGEDPGHVLNLDPREQQALMERAEEAAASDPEPETPEVDREI